MGWVNEVCSLLFSYIIALDTVEETVLLLVDIWAICHLYTCSVPKSCLTLCSPMDCSLPGSSVYGISWARMLEQIATSFSRGSS